MEDENIQADYTYEHYSFINTVFYCYEKLAICRPEYPSTSRFSFRFVGNHKYVFHEPAWDFIFESRLLQGERETKSAPRAKGDRSPSNVRLYEKDVKCLFPRSGVLDDGDGRQLAEC